MQYELYNMLHNGYKDLDKYLLCYDLAFKYEDTATGFPLATIPRNKGPRGITFGRYFLIPPGAPQSHLEKAKDITAHLLSKYLPLGSGFYPYGWYRLTARQREELWGNVLDVFFKTKRKTDPKMIINPYRMINSLKDLY